MKNRIFTIVFFFATVQFLSAQEGSWPSPCGSPPGKSSWLAQYQKNPAAYKVGMDTVYYVPMSIHSVGNDNGSGHYPVSNILDALCILNQDFEEANIQFFIEGPINFINETAFNRHDTVLDGGFAMLRHNIENTLNTYFVSDPAGNCGYNLPYAGIAMNKSCSGRRSHTWAHEVGHALSLPHPFLGWEGGINWDNTIPPDFTSPAPLRVTINYTSFKDSLITDTLIIDTVFVEFVNRSNCEVAADGFCDTEADYLASRWNCNPDQESSVVQTDPDGEKFRSDGTLIMSYSDDDCAARFSPEQIFAMRANLVDEKPNLLYNQVPLAEIDENFEVQFISPVGGEAVPANNAFLQWEPVTNATQYIVQISRLPSFPIVEEQIVEVASATFMNLLPNTTYYWRIRPFNTHSTCAGWSSEEQFTTTDVSAVSDVIPSVWNVFPNLLSKEQPCRLFIDAEENSQCEVIFTDYSGRILWQESVVLHEGRNELKPREMTFSPGVYFITLRNELRTRTHRVMVQ